MQNRGTPKTANIVVRSKKRPRKEEVQVPKKRAKRAEIVHDVDVEEVEDEVLEEDEDEDQIPPTQLPEPNSSKRRETRRSSQTAIKNPPQSAPSKAAKRPSKPIKASVILSQKKKDNISSSFISALNSKGLSDELQKTKRYFFNLNRSFLMLFLLITFCLTVIILVLTFLFFFCLM